MGAALMKQDKTVSNRGVSIISIDFTLLPGKITQLAKDI